MSATGEVMTRGIWFGRVIPVLAIIYVIVLIAVGGSGVATIGALLLALAAMIGVFVIRPEVDPNVPRSDRRAQRRRMRA